MIRLTKIMLQTKLLLLEYATVNDDAQNHWKLTAIRNIKELLLQIDLDAEVVPVSSVSKLQNLLMCLKGKELTTDESKLIEELVTI